MDTNNGESSRRRNTISVTKTNLESTDDCMAACKRRYKAEKSLQANRLKRRRALLDMGARSRGEVGA
ncbi:MAG: hypothetical protein A3G59_00185 [Candidatus Taylorbacteria bacterium RIFCSPLOWO2_12_FULL_47_20]|uniref:Uncharacterized protein n=2 Tax=Candidatus Tayloriibacteriota TaxID=1817919 RepID=A0A1G2P7H0_9BACT|nr:MAG: hypothetical protein A3H68_00570 [Candidatus Taylorbacteria bacterium RIFCSPLOWO2_02_FULL_46_40]OHA44223.1 MAG: hypothetical protein A3G59_00185 [Candidatus Taylorbacteria bacterium RIFCSPLOWO2_12_FULL_47_20]